MAVKGIGNWPSTIKATNSQNSGFIKPNTYTHNENVATWSINNQSLAFCCMKYFFLTTRQVFLFVQQITVFLGCIILSLNDQILHHHEGCRNLPPQGCVILQEGHSGAEKFSLCLPWASHNDTQPGGELLFIGLPKMPPFQCLAPWFLPQARRLSYRRR